MDTDSIIMKSCDNEDYQALKEFLMDIDCLDPLAEWTSKFNMFDILKISRTEIRHSNMLSWLLNPKENHGLGDDVIRRFVQYAITAFSDEEDVFSILLKDCSDFAVFRELHNIDILAVSEEGKMVLCIENKIDSTEHDNQLVRYRKYVEEQYAGYSQMYIYLSPFGDEPTDSDYWCSMDYESVLSIIEAAKNRVQLIPEAEMMISNYIDAIRRDIVGDERLAQICAEIYKKHQKAIDLIVENKPDKASGLADLFKQWAQNKTEAGEIEVVLDKCSKKYTRFKTKAMSEILPDADEPLSGWNTTNNYFYDIVNNAGNEFYIQFAISSKNLSDELMEKCIKINELHPSRQQKTNWQWRSHYTTKHIKVDDDYSEEVIIAQLDKALKEIKSFEDKLCNELGN